MASDSDSNAEGTLSIEEDLNSLNFQLEGVASLPSELPEVKNVRRREVPTGVGGEYDAGSSFFPESYAPQSVPLDNLLVALETIGNIKNGNLEPSVVLTTFAELARLGKRSQAYVDELSGDQADFDLSIREFQTQIVFLERRLDGALEKKGALETVITRAQFKLGDLQQSFTEEQEKNLALGVRIQDLGGRLRKYESTYDDSAPGLSRNSSVADYDVSLRDDLRRSEVQVISLKNSNADLLIRAEFAEEECARQQDKIQAQSQEIKDQNQKIQDQNQKIQDQNQEIEDQSQKIERYEISNGILQADLKERERITNSVSVELKELKASIDSGGNTRRDSQPMLDMLGHLVNRFEVDGKNGAPSSDNGVDRLAVTAEAGQRRSSLADILVAEDLQQDRQNSTIIADLRDQLKVAVAENQGLSQLLSQLSEATSEGDLAKLSSGSGLDVVASIAGKLSSVYALETRIDTLGRENNDLRGKVFTLEDAADLVADEHRKQLEGLSAQHTAELEAARSRVSELEQTAETYGADMAALREQLAAAQRQATEATEAEAEAAQKRVGELEQAAGQLENLRGQLAEAKEELEKKETALGELCNQLATARREAWEATQRATGAEEAQCVAELAALQAANDKTTAERRLVFLRAEVGEYKQVIAGQREVMQESRAKLEEAVYEAGCYRIAKDETFALLKDSWKEKDELERQLEEFQWIADEARQAALDAQLEEAARQALAVAVAAAALAAAQQRADTEAAHRVEAERLLNEALMTPEIREALRRLIEARARREAEAQQRREAEEEQRRIAAEAAEEQPEAPEQQVAEQQVAEPDVAVEALSEPRVLTLKVALPDGVELKEGLEVPGNAQKFVPNVVFEYVEQFAHIDALPSVDQGVSLQAQQQQQPIKGGVLFEEGIPPAQPPAEFVSDDEVVAKSGKKIAAERLEAMKQAASATASDATSEHGGDVALNGSGAMLLAQQEVATEGSFKEAVDEQLLGTPAAKQSFAAQVVENNEDGLVGIMDTLMRAVSMMPSPSFGSQPIHSQEANKRRNQDEKRSASPGDASSAKKKPAAKDKKPESESPAPSA
ncbi:MAG: hypothetical protein COA94_01430 [Rickettsiales bacterium]|nr:MAG: hypothetical protein COA94_01430 [Rickettsiales bacterium]